MNSLHTGSLIVDNGALATYICTLGNRHLSGRLPVRMQGLGATLAMMPVQQKAAFLQLAWAAALATCALLAPSAALGDASEERNSVGIANSETVATFSLTDAEAAYDLGYVEVNAVRSFRLAVRNGSDSPLRIAEIRSECSCMRATAATEDIPVGGEATLIVEFHAPRRASHYAKRLVLLLEGGRPMKFPILITARVGLPLTVEPKTLDLGTLIAGETRRCDVVVRNDGPTSVRPVYATSSGTGCHAAVPRAEVPAGGSLAIPVVLETGAQASGSGKASVAIHTDCHEQSQVQAAVSYEVSPTYRLSQGEVGLGTASPGERRSCRFEITAADPQARDFVRSCELTELENLSGETTVSYKENRATVTCSLVAATKAAPVGGKVLVMLVNHTQAVEVSISGLVGAPATDSPDRAKVSADAGLELQR